MLEGQPFHRYVVMNAECGPPSIMGRVWKKRRNVIEFSILELAKNFKQDHSALQRSVAHFRTTRTAVSVPEVTQGKGF